MLSNYRARAGIKKGTYQYISRRGKGITIINPYLYCHDMQITHSLNTMTVLGLKDTKIG